LTVTAAHTFSIVKQTSGLVAYDPLNNVTLTQAQLQSRNKYWTYGGSAQAQGAPFAISEDPQGFHVGVQAKAEGKWAGYYALTPLTNAHVYHAVITDPVRTTPQNIFNTALYVQTGNGLINYVYCGAQSTTAGTTWEVWSATGNVTMATTFTQLWADTSFNQPLTRSCTIVTNGSNSLTVYLDNAQVYSSNTLNLQMPSPFMAFIESQTSYAGQMLTGTFTDFYISMTESLTVTSLPSNASSVQLVDSGGNVIMTSSVSNGVAVFDIAKYPFPLYASVVVKDSSGSTIVASGVLPLVGGDTYAVVAS
jgi:hypothetical protein